MNSLLTDELLQNIGRSTKPREELVTGRDIRKYSVATGQRLQKFLTGDVAPPLYHLALFWDVVELDEVALDEHLHQALDLVEAIDVGIEFVAELDELVLFDEEEVLNRTQHAFGSVAVFVDVEVHHVDLG